MNGKAILGIGVLVIIGLSIVVEGICGKGSDDTQEYLIKRLRRIDNELDSARFFKDQVKHDMLTKEKEDLLNRLNNIK